VVPKTVRINETIGYWERYTHSPHQKFVALVEVEVWMRVESLAGIFPGQSNDCMVEHIKGEALAVVFLEIRVEELEAPLEEIPSMVKLDAP